jgi:hypothetical protein
VALGCVARGEEGLYTRIVKKEHGVVYISSVRRERKASL